ncbi:MAG: hypothetical protein ACXVDJ_03255 [Tumebacillaceae bacterium]
MDLDMTLHKLLMGDEPEQEGGLVRSFKRTLQKLFASGTDILTAMRVFAESEEFERTFPVEEGGQGISLEEAFYHYLRFEPLFAEGSPNFYLLTHEFLHALLEKLTDRQAPAFVINTWQVRDNGTVRYALQKVPLYIAEYMSDSKLEGETEALVVWLYAAVGDHLVAERISSFEAEMMEFCTPEVINTVQDDLLSKYDLTLEVFEANVAKLRDLGLIAPE